MFFLGVLLTAAGSSYYHLSPGQRVAVLGPPADDHRLHGPGVGADRRSCQRPRRLLLLAPLLLVGMASVVYWIVTERRGEGNVLPYALLQGYAVFVLLLMAILNPSRYTRASDLYFIFGWYVLAKILESFDAQVLAYSQLVSGHTLKHVAAAAAGFVACNMLMKRRLLAPPNTHR